MTNRPNAQNLIALLAAIVAVIGAGISVVVTIDDDGAGPNPPREITVKIPKAGQPAVAPDGTSKAKATVQDTVPRAVLGGADDHAGAKDETPTEALRAAPDQLADAQDQRERIRDTLEALPTAGASAGFAGCVTRFVRNQSGRTRPAPPPGHALHRVGQPGRMVGRELDRAFFNGPSGASSHFVIDREGHCAYIVPIEAKAWTQAAANPVSISYEIINSGREGTFMDTAGYNKLRSVMGQVARRTGIPMRRGAVRGCTVARTGIVEHKDFGICGGGHVDITPYSIAQVTRIVSSGAARVGPRRPDQTRAADRRPPVLPLPQAVRPWRHRRHEGDPATSSRASGNAPPASRRDASTPPTAPASPGRRTASEPAVYGWPRPEAFKASHRRALCR